MVSADADRVTQILTNLLSNAHKYTPDGGSIRVTAEMRDIIVWVAVRDSGIGLTPDERAQLFTKFFRAQNATTRAIGGTGLGLAITRSLVEMHGGEMGVVSAVGEGSTFSFTLPVAQETVKREMHAQTIPAAGRLLVVDDEPDIAMLIRRYLERSGFQVLVAHDAAQALTLARTEQPDLITLDVMLPDTDGFTLLEWLKSDVETAAIPVVMLSITDDSGRGKLLGAVDYLRKPVDEHVLLAHVQAILAEAHGRVILVADDDPDVRALLVERLNHAGYAVLEAADGAQAVELARRHHPGLALLDIRMPGTDGIAALRMLRDDAATRDMPVVMMTASPEMLEASRSMIETCGGTTLVSKPLTAHELAVAISNGFASRGEGRPAGATTDDHRTAPSSVADRGNAREP